MGKKFIQLNFVVYISELRQRSMRNANIYLQKPSILLAYIIFSGIASSTFSSCSTHRAIRLKNKSFKEWSAFRFEEVKKSPESEIAKWVIYSRKIEGSSFLEYKIEGNIESTPKNCVTAFRQDIHNQANNLKNKKYPTYNIVNESTDSLLIYLIHKEPFPFKNTEMSLRYLFFQSTESDTEEVKWEEAWDEYSPDMSKKLSRIQTFRGSWNFTSINHDNSLAVYSVQFDPKKMPMWLAEPMVNNLLVDGLEDMREMTSK